MLNIFRIFKRKNYPIWKVKIYRKNKNNCSKCDRYRDLYSMVKKGSIDLYTSTANWTYRNLCYSCIECELMDNEPVKKVIIRIDES